MAATRSVRLSTKANKQLTDAVTPDGKYSAVAPSQQMYGIYGPQYAALMAQPSPSASLSAFREASLKTNSELEQQAYERQLANANATQEKLRNLDGYYGILKSRDDHLNDDVEQGMGGVRGAPVFDDQYGVWKTEQTPGQEVQLINANENVLNNDQAERLSKQAGAVNTLGQAGYGLSLPDVGKLITPPTQVEPMQVIPHINPHDETDRYAADEGLSKEDQFRMAEINKAAKENGDKVEGALTIGANGVAQVVYKGSPEALAKYGIDPATGRPLNPNAGANSGTAPAQPTAKPHKEAATPVTNGKQIALSVYPGIQVTDNRRDPNSKLGKANPDSWHVRTGAAVDVRPIKGMTFEQYVDGYKQKGYHVIEAIDEVKHPSKHATGPHWHVVLGKPVDTSTVYAKRLQNSPSVASVQHAADGSLLVTLKSGKQVVVKDGKRIG